MARDEVYRAAEKKIEEARLSGKKKLNLSGSGRPNSQKLAVLPESLGQLTQLQSLDLSNNQLTTLPVCLGQLTQLQSLDLSNNQLTTLPEWLGALTQLLTLGLANLGPATLPEALSRLTQLQSLDVSAHELTMLPSWLEKLTELQSLSLSDNQITTLPEWLGRLVKLRSLEIINNKLTLIPKVILNLSNLIYLNLYGNHLTEIPNWVALMPSLSQFAIGNNNIATVPDSLGDCERLLTLNLGDEAGGNPIGSLPLCIRRLRHLRELHVAHCQLKVLPAWTYELQDLIILNLHHNFLYKLPPQIGQLNRLSTLILDYNHLSELPIAVAQIEQLNDLRMDENPLEPGLAAAYREGLDAVKRYLQEMAKGARNRYEAKLLILGDGNEGKTCVSRALRDLPFRIQKTTHGVDVEQWTFPHPDHSTEAAKEITLNIWDFEGQEISHQTHQFFLTSHSLYLLVFRCRDQFPLDRAEYWLDTIRARAPKAKVAIVITQCEVRYPHVPQDRLQSQYADLLATEWFFTVGCKSGHNIKKLQTFLQRWAADLEFMGSLWPMSYDKAETEIKAKTRTAQITRDKLYGVFAKAGVNKDNYGDAAAAMSRLGVITQFPDCPDLRDFVVLRPQWLTKAISKVMGDDKLSEDIGEITLNNMEGIWNAAGYRGMFATFHNCMKEFELCYDLEDDARSCLVPLRFGYVQPTIPWSNIDGMKTRRVEYKLNIRPPMGIMSRFIVKTHHMIVKTEKYPKGIYWYNGVFLRTGEGAFCSEVLCEYVAEERKLRIEVRAAYPQNLTEQIHAYVKSVLSFFDGLDAERSYGCIIFDPNSSVEQRCVGFHTEKRIFSEMKNRSNLNCEFSLHQVDPNKLIWGFGSFGDNAFINALISQLRPEFDRRPDWAAPLTQNILTLLTWMDENRVKVKKLLDGQANLLPELKQEAELKLHEYLGFMSKMLDDRDHTAAPGLISITAKDRSRWNPVKYFKNTYVLTPFCECEANIHACDDAKVEFTKDKQWWATSATWIARATKPLAIGLQLAFVGVPVAVGPVAEAIKDDLKFMQELSKHLELEAPEEDKLGGADHIIPRDVTQEVRGDDAQVALMRASLERLLEETAPDNYRARRWGSLKRIRMRDNTYRWLCETCATRYR